LEEFVEQINLYRGSGEYSLKHIFIVGGKAYYPLAPRIRELDIPVGLMYGDSEEH